MGGAGLDTEIGRMQAALRAWVVRAAGGTRGLREIAPTALLCASAFTPLLPVVAGSVLLRSREVGYCPRSAAGR
jgi:hypothetical protein